MYVEHMIIYKIEIDIGLWSLSSNSEQYLERSPYVRSSVNAHSSEGGMISDRTELARIKKGGNRDKHSISEYPAVWSIRRQTAMIMAELRYDTLSGSNEYNA